MAELLASGADDLAERWADERDQRDALAVPIADRLELLRSIEAVTAGASNGAVAAPSSQEN